MKKRILVIDDDLTVCRSIRETMQDDHTDVCYAMSVLEALHAFAAYDYCLVIVDLRLSEADSMDILRIIRQAKATPILTLAEKPTEDEKVNVFRAGANAVLEKPLDISVCSPGQFVDPALYGTGESSGISPTDIRDRADN